MTTTLTITLTDAQRRQLDRYLRDCNAQVHGRKLTAEDVARRAVLEAIGWKRSEYREAFWANTCAANPRIDQGDE